VSTPSRVARLGPLLPELQQALLRHHGTRLLDELGPAEAEHVEVAVASGRFGASREAMDRLPALRAVVHFGVGYDSTDVAEATRRGIVVSNTPDVLTNCVADAAVGLVIDVLRGLSAADRFVRRGDWAAGASFPLARQVTSARVGVLGLGRIGLAVAYRLDAFDARISYHSRAEKPGVAYEYAASARELAAGCDVLVVTASGGPESAHLVDAEVLAALGPEGFLVNVARGSVVDEKALVTALAGGRLAGAGLDVFADEPRVPAELLDRDDVVLLPHLASGTAGTRSAMARLVLDNVERFLRDGTLATPIG